jgi:hypothetical protein
MLTLPEGVSVSWLDKHISRLGNFTNTRTLKVAKKSAIYITGSPFTSFSGCTLTGEKYMDRARSREHFQCGATLQRFAS